MQKLIEMMSKLDRITQLLADRTQWNSTNSQNPPICDPPLWHSATFYHYKYTIDFYFPGDGSGHDHHEDPGHGLVDEDQEHKEHQEEEEQKRLKQYT